MVPSETPRSVTELLDAWGRGDRAAVDPLVPWIRRELTTA